MPQQTDTRLRPKQVAAKLQVSLTTVLMWIHSGKLRAFNVARNSSRPRWRIRPSDLDALEEKEMRQTPTVSRRRRTEPGVTEYFCGAEGTTVMRLP